MYAKTIAITGAFAALVAAVPMAKRDMVWVTETEEAIVTVPVTTTLWVDPTGTPSHYGHPHSHKHTKTVQSTVTVQPTSTASVESLAVPSSYEAPAPSPSDIAPVSSAEESSSSSVYVAPAPSSAYVAPSTSSVYVAPSTSTSVYIAPTPTSTYVAPTTSSVYVAPASTETPTTTSSAAPAYSSSSGDGVTGMGAPGSSYEGDLTYFAVGLGACGETSTESDHMVAISETIFDSYLAAAGGNPNKVAICGKYITIEGADGNAYKAQIMDRCPGCSEGSLDLPQLFFNKVTTPAGSSTPADGRAHNVKWSFD